MSVITLQTPVPVSSTITKVSINGWFDPTNTRAQLNLTAFDANGRVVQVPSTAKVSAVYAGDDAKAIFDIVAEPGEKLGDLLARAMRSKVADFGL